MYVVLCTLYEDYRVRSLTHRRRPRGVRRVRRRDLRVRRARWRPTASSSLGREDAGFNLIFLRAGLASFKPVERAQETAAGLIVALVVDDIDAEYERLVDAGMPILTPIETEDWGERYFQVADPNGVILQLVQWVAQPT